MNLTNFKYINICTLKLVVKYIFGHLVFQSWDAALPLIIEVFPKTKTVRKGSG